jgi:2-haloacid dehalogenase
VKISTMSTETPSNFQPKAIIFDLLTALLDSWTLWNHATRSPSRGLEWRKAYLELTYGCGSYQPYEDLVQQAALQVGLGPEAPEYLLKHWDDLKPWPESVSVLERLRSKGLKIGVVTNCSTELGGWAARFFAFDAVVTAEEAGFYKPHVKPYEDVLKKLDVRAEDALFVAGSAADVPGAAGVGMKVVWHNRVGLEAKGGVQPLREAATLEDVLEG